MVEVSDMAQFYAEIQGNRGAASRTGSKASGMSVHIRGWHVGIRVNCHYDEATGQDVVTVERTGGSAGHGRSEHLATLKHPEATS